MAQPPTSPTVGAAVVVFLVRRSDQHVLIGKRKGKHGDGEWELPGGQIEYGESFSDSCQREVREETGLNCRNIQLVCVKNKVFDVIRRQFVVLFFSAECIDDDPQPVTMEPDKSQGWRWVPWCDICQGKYTPLFGILNDIAQEYPEPPWRMEVQTVKASPTTT
ncbi:hypothetical protein IWQ62_003805 [Dispira parvispora]|uniref:Nudix hydrolase domain-containing protein n=1 Tax=Dispira parvispora TaxID=1520584 RepID=A0A9W8AR32_9FUNG|nr:hypothetical protein IWQ62_003805 [Dispira parvispora]